MVSSVLGMELTELLATLQRIRREYQDDPEYQQLRAELPDDWPM
jgi:hypothetical protein